ncbi:hypothetical protein P7C73_g1696, partial [Tremellales sp. Uapishka_1]
MRTEFVILECLIFTALGWATPLKPRSSSCRFAASYTLADIIANSSSFQYDYLSYESKFHAANVSYNPLNGMTYDGTLLDVDTGYHNISGLHHFSAPSKEAQQNMIYALALSGNRDAQIWVCSADPDSSANKVYNILKTKLATYQQFNQTFPGFGGLLPWYANNGSMPLTPTSDWVNRMPSLDNGENIWSIYAIVSALETSDNSDYQDLGKQWQAYLDAISVTAAQLFYLGDGNVCTVINLNQSVPLGSPAHNLSCPLTAQPYLNDPFEGELFTWFLYLYSPVLNDTDRDQLWVQKRPQLIATEYSGSVVNVSASDVNAVNYTGAPIVTPYSPNITVQKGFWFSAHEQWKILEMPYLDDPLFRRVFHNAERARTCDAKLIGNPGMFASVNNVTNPVTNDVYGYISYEGIPSIANQTTQELNVITPYSTMATMMFNKTVGLAWVHNMLLGQGMQNPYGSSEASNRDGSAISAFVSWDSKATTVVGLLGGVGNLVRAKLQREGKYSAFRTRLHDEFALTFGNITLSGEDVDLCYPAVQIPSGGAVDFSGCQ